MNTKTKLLQPTSKVFAAKFFLVLFCSLVLAGQTTFAQTTATWVPTNGTQGGTWNATATNWTTNNGTSFFATTNGAYDYLFANTNGAVTNGAVLIGGEVWGNKLTFGVTGYSLGANAPYNLTATNGVVLSNNVNLTLRSSAGNTLTFLGLSNGITGGTGSTITLGKGEKDLTNSFFFSGGTIAASVPITVNIGTNSVIHLGTKSSSGFTNNATIANSSVIESALVITNSTNGTVTLNGAISGTSGLNLGNGGTGKIVLNAANSYSGGTIISSPGGSQISYSNNSAFGTGLITIAGAGTNYIRGVAVASSGFGFELSNNVTINSGSILQLGAGNQTNKVTMSGTISGPGGILQNYLDAGLYLTGTNNSFGGGVSVPTNASVYITKLGNAGFNSSIGTNGNINLGGATTGGTLRWIGTESEESDKRICVTGQAGGATVLANGTNSVTNPTLTLTRDFVISGGGAKVLTFGAYGSTNTNGPNKLRILGAITNGPGGTIVAGTSYTPNYTNKISISPIATNQAASLTSVPIGGPGIPNGTTITSATTNSLTLSANLTNTTVLTNGTVFTNGVVTVTLSNDVLSPYVISALSVSGITNGSITTGPGITATTRVASIVKNYINLDTPMATNTAFTFGSTTFTNDSANSAVSLKVGTSQYGSVFLENTNNSFSGGVNMTNNGGAHSLSVSKIGNPGELSCLGTSGTITFGGTSGSQLLLYTGNGETNSKQIVLTGAGGNGLANKGTGALKFTGLITPTNMTASKKLYLDTDLEGATLEIASSISDGTFLIGISKNGLGTTILSASNSFGDPVEIKGGTLRLATNNAVKAGVPVNFLTNGVGSDALEVAYTGDSPELGKLTLSGPATINLGTNNNAKLIFFQAHTWGGDPNTTILTIQNYQNGAKLYINDTNGVPLSQIKASGQTNLVASLATNGLLTFTAPVSAPSNLVYNPSTINATVGKPFTGVAPTVGGSDITYSIYPDNSDLPTGLVINPLTGVISGTPAGPATSGSLIVQVRATNSGGYASTAVAIDVVEMPADTTAPVITRTGNASIVVAWGDSYTDAGATATDNVDSSVTVTPSGSVNTAVPGTYTITYNASDAANNNATQVTRTVTVSAPSSEVGADGLSGLLRYAFGANGPSDTVTKPTSRLSAGKLAITAIVRTNNPNLTVVGQAVTNLPNYASGTSIVGADVAPDADQANVTSGCQRQTFSVDQGIDAKKFLRLKATLNNP
jgi:autotransporter-associated beta strand protein